MTSGSEAEVYSSYLNRHPSRWKETSSFEAFFSSVSSETSMSPLSKDETSPLVLQLRDCLNSKLAKETAWQKEVLRLLQAVAGTVEDFARDCSLQDTHKNFFVSLVSPKVPVSPPLVGVAGHLVQQHPGSSLCLLVFSSLPHHMCLRLESPMLAT